MMITQKEGWRLFLPKSATGKKDYNFSYIGTLGNAKAALDKSILELAEKYGVWTPMSTSEIEAAIAQAEEDLDRF
jgi:hypothetical protein